jgi:hypothetical protein
VRPYRRRLQRQRSDIVEPRWKARAQIFNGQTSFWNDATIRGLNLGVTFPGKLIRVVFRSDESGTTHMIKSSDGSTARQVT